MCQTLHSSHFSKGLYFSAYNFVVNQQIYCQKLLQILSFLMHFSFTSDSKRNRGHSEGRKAESSRSRVDGRVEAGQGGRLDGGHQSRTKEENSEKRRRQMRRTQSEAAVNKKVRLTIPYAYQTKIFMLWMNWMFD